MKKFLSVIGGLISFVICSFLFIFQFCFLTFLNIRTLSKENTLESILNNVDVVQILQNEDEAMDEIYEVTNEIGLTKEDTNKLLNSESVKSFVSKVLSNNIKSIYDGEPSAFTSEDIKVLITDVQKETGISINNNEELITLINENSNEIVKALNLTDSIEDELGEDTILLIRNVLNPAIIVGSVIMLVVFYLLICLFRWSMYKPFIWYGITSIVSGVLFLLPSLLITTLTSILITGENVKYLYVINNVLKPLQVKSIIFSLSTIILGVLFIILYSVIKKKKTETVEDVKLENI